MIYLNSVYVLLSSSITYIGSIIYNFYITGLQFSGKDFRIGVHNVLMLNSVNVLDL